METHLVNNHTINLVEIKKNKEEHSFYMFVALVVFGLLVLQPISMTLIMVVQTVMQQ